MAQPLLKITLHVTLAMFAFAANSIFARLALQSGDIDAALFTYVRLISGAVFLVFFSWVSKKNFDLMRAFKEKKNQIRSLLLFGYALLFSLAYVKLNTGTGALILFASVQFTMICIHILSGNRISVKEWLGILFSVSGFLYLMLPGVEAPDPFAGVLMILSGVCWAAFTIAGKGQGSAIENITYAFIGAGALSLLLVGWTADLGIYSLQSIAYALLSGALASGAGYVVWYSVLPHLSVLNASVVQLSVPLLAAFGGVLFLQETLSFALSVSAFLILGGIAVVLRAR